MCIIYNHDTTFEYLSGWENWDDSFTWNCIEWLAVCGIGFFLKSSTFVCHPLNCTAAVPGWSPDNSKCISFLWFSLQIQFPSFPDRTSHHVFPFPLRLHPATNSLFSNSRHFSCNIITIRLVSLTNTWKPSNADQSWSPRHHCCCHKKFLTCRWFNFRRFYCIKALGNFSQ